MDELLLGFACAFAIATLIEILDVTMSGPRVAIYVFLFMAVVCLVASHISESNN